MKYGMWFVNGGFFEHPGNCIEEDVLPFINNSGQFETTDINIAYKALRQLENWRDTKSSSPDWTWEIREKP